MAPRTAFSKQEGFTRSSLWKGLMDFIKEKMKADLYNKITVPIGLQAAELLAAWHLLVTADPSIWREFSGTIPEHNVQLLQQSLNVFYFDAT